jgi:hypothetical protein
MLSEPFYYVLALFNVGVERVHLPLQVDAQGAQLLDSFGDVADRFFNVSVAIS